MADLLRKAQLPDLSYYQAVGKSVESTPKKRDRKASTVSTEDTPPAVGVNGVAGSANSAVRPGAEMSSFHTTALAQQPQYAIDKEENGAASLVTAPMGSLYEVTQLSDIRATSPERQHAHDLVTDFVSRGAVDLQEAEELFDHFDRVLNRYLWDGILLVHKDLTSLRNSSSMLSAAIFAVTSLHLPNKERTFDAAYAEFAKLASESMLDRHHTLDDLRALCIGAFWLSDVSWKLSGIYHAFGPDVDLEVPESEFSIIDKFDTDLGDWRSAWLPRLAGSRYVGAYPYKAVYLHYNFCRLQLNSVALRTYHSSNSTRPMSAERKKRANLAIESAIGTLMVVLDEPDIQRALVGVPLYLHSMITFAAVFLLKIAAKGYSNIVTSSQNQQNSIASAGLHIDVSKRASERHLSHHISRGLMKMLTGLEEWEKRSYGNPQSFGQGAQDNASMFKPVIIPGAQPLGERDTILNHPPPLLGVAPLSAERGNGVDFEVKEQQIGLSEGSADPMMADLWGFDEEYFPTGVFDFLQSQMPA
ncbi:Zn(II)2Cys6 transcription factor [Aspergillus mulundensis]|uniref:Zn(II)2Cys6 transcription factor n=1 Tax=Aspergillus mulundensis TaxID=1810919 RepID=A0A3D8SIX6_9EURO|nr:Zn(II)2Cys6 transcription factor [Aspergillus mulundensis]RDW86131.1 Zn(II)2Cys6 transcription factor [Aspergillus mulundensis]